MGWDEEFPEGRHYGMEEGTVYDNVDPKGLGRVRVYIPGLCEPASGWAWPVGTMGGGAPQVGTFWIPPKNATVVVFFKSGDIDQPRYMSGHWGIPDAGTEVPTPVKTLPAADVPKVRVFETERFLLVFDNRSGNEALYLKDKVSGEQILLGGTNGIKIKGTVKTLADPTLMPTPDMLYPDCPSDTLQSNKPKRMVAAAGAPFMICKSGSPADMNPTQMTIRGSLYLADQQNALTMLSAGLTALQVWATAALALSADVIDPAAGGALSALGAIITGLIGPTSSGPIATALAQIIANFPNYLTPNLIVDDPGPMPTALTMVSIALAPLTVPLAPAGTQQLVCTGTLSNASTEVVTGTVTSWVSSNPAAATVNASGLVTAVADGVSVITASLGAHTATSTVTVSG